MLNQVAAGEGERTRADVTAVLPGYLAAVRHRGWITQDAGKRFQTTAEEKAVHTRIAKLQESLRAEVHHGNTDREYTRALKVLRRMIDNVRGEAWHH